MRTWAITFFLSLACGAVGAQTPPPRRLEDFRTLGNVDLSGLTPVQKKAVLKLLARRIAPASAA